VKICPLVAVGVDPVPPALDVPPTTRSPCAAREMTLWSGTMFRFTVSESVAGSHSVSAPPRVFLIGTVPTAILPPTCTRATGRS
jgi:hypothetical protein